MAKKKKGRSGGRSTEPQQGDQPPDSYDDLRAKLPPELMDTAEVDIPQVWVAWRAASAGHPADYLVRTVGLQRAAAERIAGLVGPSGRRAS